MTARIAPQPRDGADPRVAEAYDRVFGEGRDPIAEPGASTGAPGDWWTTWGREPDILDAFSAYKGSTLDPKLRELATMRTGYGCQSQFVFSQHCKVARLMGVSEAKIAAIPVWSISDVYDARERAVLAYVDAMIFEDGRVHDLLFAALKGFFTEPEILMLTYGVNMFRLHATTTKALKLEYDNVPERIVEVPAPANRPDLNPPLAEAGT